MIHINPIEVKVEFILIKLLYDMSIFFGKIWVINQKTPTTNSKGIRGNQQPLYPMRIITPMNIAKHK